MKQYTLNDVLPVARDLQQGKVLAFPTDTVFGVGVLYGNPGALARLKEVKHRPETKPIPMMCAKLEQAEKIVQIPDEARKIAEAFLPGALTLILPLQPDADRLYTNGKDSAALRIPDAPFLLQVMEQLDCPLLVTSANISGMPAALTTGQALDALKEIDGIVDGECEAKQASTIIDCTKTPLTLVRQGPVSFEQICAVLGDKTTELS